VCGLVCVVLLCFLVFVGVLLLCVCFLGGLGFGCLLWLCLLVWLVLCGGGEGLKQHAQ